MIVFLWRGCSCAKSPSLCQLLTVALPWPMVPAASCLTHRSFGLPPRALSSPATLQVQILRCGQAVSGKLIALVGDFLLWRCAGSDSEYREESKQ